MVSKVARRLAPKRQRSRTNNKEGGPDNDNQQQDNTDVDRPQSGYPRRGRGGRGGGRPRGGYFMEHSKIIKFNWFYSI
jgi:hypothetical protein